MMKLPARHRMLAGALTLSALAGAMLPAPAFAQFGLGGIVYDPTNYTQNVLTAARTLEQINNQICQIQNQAQSLINEAKNLTSLPVSTLSTLQSQVNQTRRLLSQAQRIAYSVQDIQQAFTQRYNGANLTASQGQMVANANARWQDSVGAYQDALQVQAGVVGNIDGAQFDRHAGIGQPVGERRPPGDAGRQPAPRAAIAAACRSHCRGRRAGSGASARCGPQRR